MSNLLHNENDVILILKVLRLTRKEFQALALPLQTVCNIKPVPLEN